jgi:hypothetical protein
MASAEERRAFGSVTTMAKLPRTGVAYRSLDEPEVTLAEIVRSDFCRTEICVADPLFATEFTKDAAYWICT